MSAEGALLQFAFGGLMMFLLGMWLFDGITNGWNNGNVFWVVWCVIFVIFDYGTGVWALYG
jgi:hypothetical protein